MEDEIKKEAPEEKEIDLMELALKLWKKRKYIFTWIFCGAIFGLIIAFSIPKEYTTKVVVAPEIASKASSGGGLSSLASLAGINLSSMNSSDAVTPMLYPDIVSSVPFNVELFDIEVETKGKNPQRMTVREYLENEMRTPWWGAIMSLPGKAIGGVMGLFRETQEDSIGKPVDPFRLTNKEALLVKALNQRITADVDNKTAIITITVMMQDPVVSAMLADTVVERLKTYVTEYRTQKANDNLQYAQLLYDEARTDYLDAQQRYAAYADRNNNITLHSGRIELERLQNEASLRFNVYNSTAQQLQVAKAKVQEEAPVYTTIQPATVAIRASKPSKMMMIIGFAFLAFVISAAWILYGQEMWSNLKKANAETESAEEEDTEAQE